METAPTYEPDTFAGFINPEQNWSRLPHQLIEALPLIETLGEMKVILYVLRHTWGFHDKDKKITTDEFWNGRKRRDGSRLDKGTGLSKPTIIDGIERAVKHGFLEVEIDERDKGRVKKFYSLTSSDVKKLDTTGQESLHRSEKETLERNLIHGADAQHTDDSFLGDGQETTTQENPAQTRLNGARQRLGSDMFALAQTTEKARQEQTLRTVPEDIPKKNVKGPAIDEFKRATGYMPPRTWRSKIVQYVGDEPDNLERWYSVCDAWIGCGWNPRNVKGMLDFYIIGALPATTGGNKPSTGNSDSYVPAPNESMVSI